MWLEAVERKDSFTPLLKPTEMMYIYSRDNFYLDYSCKVTSDILILLFVLILLVSTDRIIKMEVLHVFSHVLSGPGG
jgi:hypothetical protein